ncbi:hypothetical protein [Pseudomonas sp. DY-1]|uniref:hypothetical protein n=1 Tax=Pseudomonas sp. DY-1 TaxID=1755504 RepID=UPI001C498E2E|nr:hypothetical protein [Pseudomonas sp. DY-1]
MTDKTLQLDGGLTNLETEAPSRWSLRTWFAVSSMAATSFALVSAEFLPAGLLTPMARDLGITEGTVGQVVTATASVGAVMALLSNVLIGRLNRKTVLMGLSALAILSNLLAAEKSDGIPFSRWGVFPRSPGFMGFRPRDDSVRAILV